MSQDSTFFERARSNPDLYARAGLAVFGLIVFVTLVLRLSGWPVPPPDAIVFEVVRGPVADVPMVLAAHIGGEEAMALGTAALMTVLIHRRAVRAAVFLGVGLTLGNLGSAMLKWVFDRSRPPIDYQPSLVLPGWTNEVTIGLALLILVVCWPTRWRRHGLLLAGLTAVLQVIDVAGETVFIDQELGSSFPSGHALRSGAWAVSLVLISWVTPWRRWVLLVTAAFVLVVGVSRVYLGVHYPSDVLAGWAIALAAVVAVSLIPRLDPLRPAGATGDGSNPWAGRLQRVSALARRPPSQGSTSPRSWTARRGSTGPSWRWTWAWTPRRPLVRWWPISWRRSLSSSAGSSASEHARHSPRNGQPGCASAGRPRWASRPSIASGVSTAQERHCRPSPTGSTPMESRQLRAGSGGTARRWSACSAGWARNGGGGDPVRVLQHEPLATRRHRAGRSTPAHAAPGSRLLRPSGASGEEVAWSCSDVVSRARVHGRDSVAHDCVARRGLDTNINGLYGAVIRHRLASEQARQDGT